MTYSYTTGTSPNENVVQVPDVGPLPVDARALPFNANIKTKLHELWLVSENPLIYPGQYTIGGTWHAGDEAIAAIRWGTNSIGFSHVVKSGDGPQQIAKGLRDQMANDPVFASTPIFVMDIGQYGGGWSWQISPPYKTWTANPKIILSTGKTSQHGTIATPLQPVNLLDTPAMTVTLARAVPGRPAQAMDLIAEDRVMGQTDRIDSPDDVNLRQIYVNLQYYIGDPRTSAPRGFLQVQLANAGSNNVANALQLSDGLVLCDANGMHPPGGPRGDGMMGYGHLHLPKGAAIWINGKKIVDESGIHTS